MSKITLSNLECAKLKLTNFAVKFLSIEPITALFYTGATCSCISQQLFMKISDKANMIKISLKVNTASGTTLGPIRIAPLEVNMKSQIFVCNFIICSKLKQPLSLELAFSHRYRIGIDLDMYGMLFLRHEGKKIVTSLKVINPGQWTIAFLEIHSGKPQETGQKLCFNEQPYWYYTVLPHF